MATTTFDTRQAVRKLQAAGFDEAQADAVVDTLSDAFSDTVATKADIAALEASTKAEIANLKAEMFRALWIQGAGLVGVQLAIAGLLYTLLASSPP